MPWGGQTGELEPKTCTVAGLLGRLTSQARRSQGAFGRLRHQCGQALHELQRRHHDMGGAVAPALFGLLCRNDSAELSGQQTTCKTGCIANHQHVDRVAIFTKGLWNRSEVIRKNRAGRQNSAQPETLSLGVILNLLRLPLGVSTIMFTKPASARAGKD